MNDSRVEFVESLVKDAMTCQDRDAKVQLIRQAVRDWEELSQEFPVTDSLMAAVNTRLVVALKDLRIGEWRPALISLQLALSGITAVKKR